MLRRAPSLSSAVDDSGGPYAARPDKDQNQPPTLVDGNKAMPPGQVMWRGTVDQNVPNLVVAQQACASSGLGSVRTVKARIVVTDLDHLTEELVTPKACSGFPVKYTRASAADAPQRKN